MMTKLVYLPPPFVGRLFIQHVTAFPARMALEALYSSCDLEWLLYLGTFRLYWTPSSVARTEALARPSEDHQQGNTSLSSPKVTPQHEGAVKPDGGSRFRGYV